MRMVVPGAVVQRLHEMAGPRSPSVNATAVDRQARWQKLELAHGAATPPAMTHAPFKAPRGRRKASRSTKQHVGEI